MQTLIQQSKYQKYITLFCLYIAQSVPMSFFSTVVPVIMRQEKYSLEAIGLLQLIKLPWILKFLWAPLVDASGGSIKRNTRWIICSELFYAVSILLIAFLDLETNFTLIVYLMLFAFVASATQDIATDAMAILMLNKSERSMGNSMQSMGSFVGALLGAGVLLLVYNTFGWQALLFGLTAFVLIALIPLRLFKLTESTEQVAEKRVAIKYADIARFFTQKGIVKQVVMLVLFYAGIIGMQAMLKPYLVDLGYTIEQIGVMSGIIGTGVAAICALGAGWLTKRIGIKKGAILFSFILFLVPCYFYFWLEVLGFKSVQWIYIGICFLWAAYGMATIIVYTSSMNCVRKGCEGTDFTIQTVLTHLSSLIIAVSSGKLAAQFAYKGLFAIEAVIALLSFLFVYFVYSKGWRNKE